MGNQQGPIVRHRELCSMLCGSLDGRGAWGTVDTYICMAESLHGSPETMMTLLIPQYKAKSSKLKKKKEGIRRNHAEKHNH